MPKHLLIVESPAKAKTIERYLGKDFKVLSSFGHVRDLPKSDGVDVEKGFEPTYVVTSEAKKVVRDLKAQMKKSEDVWLATDEDREGEAISWHLCQVLGLDAVNTKRIVFREITKPAIQKAIQQPRTLDINLVNAQQARRVLDRLVGYELSEVLWKKVRRGLSAGRVQSVAVKLVVEREREIIAFNTAPFFRIRAEFSVEGEQVGKTTLRAESPTRFETEAEARDLLERCIDAAFRIDEIEVKPLRRKPTAPFTTSTLQQEASRKLGFSVSRTMSVAQRLYESGHITYMRTDSTNLSNTALAAIAEEVKKNYGEKYLQTRKFRKKSAGAQEAHEAIRPTYIQAQNVGSSRDERRLYELIWKRTIASQMADAVVEKTIVRIGIYPGEERRNGLAAGQPLDTYLKAEGEVLKFDGFLKVYLESTDDDDEEKEAKGILPPLNEGQELELLHMDATERFTRPPSRYTEASLVKKLEELGIGRPSTYAPTISKIMEPKRGYVVKDSRDGEERKYKVLLLRDNRIGSQTETEVTGAIRNRLFPTEMGITVSDFLDEHFDTIMDFNFTAEIEKQLDHIASGGKEWRALLEDFYPSFHEKVEETKEEADRPTRERILGVDPESGRTLLTRMTVNGPVVQIGKPEELDEGEKPKYANLPPENNIETVSLQEALRLFELPRQMGTYRGFEVEVNRGRYGPYVRYGDNFVSIPKGEDPISLTFDRAKELVDAKIKENAPVGEYKGKPITKGKGRYGPFLKWNDMFVNVPKKYDFNNLSTEEMHELIAQKEEKEAKRYIHRWPEENISVENGRWGPFIRFGKKNVKIPKVEGEKVTPEIAKEFSLEDVKGFIEAEIPDAFAKKKKSAKKKSSTRKRASKKTTKKKS